MDFNQNFHCFWSIAVFPAEGVKSADIGRIASKHVKVTVSQRSPPITGRDRQRTVTSPNDMNNSTMNHVNDKEENQVDHEEMDTDQKEGRFLIMVILYVLKMLL